MYEEKHHVRSVSHLAATRRFDAPLRKSWHLAQAAVFTLSAAIAAIYAYTAP